MKSRQKQEDDETLLYLNDNNNRKTNNYKDSPIEANAQQQTTQDSSDKLNSPDYEKLERQLLSHFFSPIASRSTGNSTSVSRNNDVLFRSKALLTNDSYQDDDEEDEEKGLNTLITHLEEQISAMNNVKDTGDSTRLIGSGLSTSTSATATARTTTKEQIEDEESDEEGLSGNIGDRDSLFLRTQKIDISKLREDIENDEDDEVDQFSATRTRALPDSISSLSPDHTAQSLNSNESGPSTRTGGGDSQRKVEILEEQCINLELHLHDLRMKMSELVATEDRKRSLARYKLDRIRRKKDPDTEAWITTLIMQHDQDMEYMRQRLQHSEEESKQLTEIAEKLNVDTKQALESVTQLSSVVNTAVPKMQQFISEVCETLQRYNQHDEITPKKVIPILEELCAKRQPDISEDDTTTQYFMKLFGVTNEDQVKSKMNALFVYTAQAKQSLQQFSKILGQDSGTMSDKDKVKSCKQILSEWK